MNIHDLNKVNRDQIQRAGARYAPGLDPSAPNIEIRDLALALSALGHEEDFPTYIRALESKVRDATRWTPLIVRRAFGEMKSTPENVADCLKWLADSKPGEQETPARELRRLVKRVQRTLRGLQARLYAKERSEAENDDAQRKLREQLNDVYRVLSPISDVSEFVESPPFELLTRNAMLLLGVWGTGKTHALCDLAERRAKIGLPTLLFLAKDLPDRTDPLQGLCDATGLALTSEDILQRLQHLGEVTGSRALVAIDAINEGNRDEWSRCLPSMIRAFRRFPNVGLVLSCRRPFDDLIFNDNTRRALITFEHRGFDEVEADAQVAFFTHYQIPAPHAPLLTPEFSRPLFLKMLCESVRNRSIRSKSKYVRDLASGQKGMTRVLEDFAKEVGRPIEIDYDLPRRTCWRLLKGYSLSRNSQVTGIAPAMAGSMREAISRVECLQLIGMFTRFETLERCEDLLHRLLADGLLVEGIEWKDGQPVTVIQFPFQRFGDHLVARSLLDNCLQTDSENAIRRSFYINKPLGRIFELAAGGLSYRRPGLAAAIMLEFPERVKRVLPTDDRELVAYLPRERQMAASLRDVFLEGLYWRTSDSFTKQTEHVINFYLRSTHEWSRYAVLEVLTSLATRPGHPYRANWLYTFLSRQSMPERDIFWSEFLRRLDAGSAVFRLLDWIERTDGQGAGDVGENCVTLLALCLTTTRRYLRDRVTRALFLLGLAQPHAVFQATVETLDFNDPYVPERMLAASYGVAMSSWADPRGNDVRRLLPKLAKDLARRLFVPTAQFHTTHALMQDYAFGVVQLARKVAPGCIPNRDIRYLRKPLKSIRSQFPAPEQISDDVEEVKSALHMDFENYTIGRLVSNRNNYDYQHTDYMGVRRQILWRVANLGYSEERFASVDREIMHQSPTREDNPGRVERYGKKYSWIAFFELYGARRIHRRLSEWADERPSDVDVDPSFPKEPRRWAAAASGIIGAGPSEPRAWLQSDIKPDYSTLLRRNEVAGITGPWVLLEGYIEEAATASDDKRRVFTFLWARFVARAQAVDLVSRFWAQDYPGNFVIPRPSSDYYTYAGEIPWSRQFASNLRSATGDAVAHIEDALPSFENIDAPTGVPVEVPIHTWSWESYHSRMNQVNSVDTLAPALCETLRLVNHARELDLFDKDGRRATIYAVVPEQDPGLVSHLLFIRENLLNQYLRAVGRELVWFVWGERDFKAEMSSDERDILTDVYQRYENIHRQAYALDRHRRTVLARQPTS